MKLSKVQEALIRTYFDLSQEEVLAMVAFILSGRSFDASDLSKEQKIVLDILCSDMDPKLLDFEGLVRRLYRVYLFFRKNEKTISCLTFNKMKDEIRNRIFNAGNFEALFDMLTVLELDYSFLIFRDSMAKTNFAIWKMIREVIVGDKVAQHEFLEKIDYNIFEKYIFIHQFCVIDFGKENSLTNLIIDGLSEYCPNTNQSFSLEFFLDHFVSCLDDVYIPEDKIEKIASFINHNFEYDEIFSYITNESGNVYRRPGNEFLLAYVLPDIFKANFKRESFSFDFWEIVEVLCHFSTDYYIRLLEVAFKHFSTKGDKDGEGENCYYQYKIVWSGSLGLRSIQMKFMVL